MALRERAWHNWIQPPYGSHHHDEVLVFASLAVLSAIIVWGVLECSKLHRELTVHDAYVYGTEHLGEMGGMRPDKELRAGFHQMFTSAPSSEAATPTRTRTPPPYLITSPATSSNSGFLRHTGACAEACAKAGAAGFDAQPQAAYTAGFDIPPAHALLPSQSSALGDATDRMSPSSYYINASTPQRNACNAAAAEQPVFKHAQTWTSYMKWRLPNMAPSSWGHQSLWRSCSAAGSSRPALL
eukprot:CAMPEP_0183357080 /NCGR_PEP_ID=MMETSP0164_2-20130417/45366_1 /TAXON_ID=221442 /ORGANISM="Coccolithus pelagicus ssp braarudi, Strain PLY182g" /LENGTH=240 /DNA_ID=CAMNT_0025530631 /DNA_START=197 /DNA_END=922 /DNA_ORIENTATION=-